ncbi:MAG: class III extradiol dioxygenase subunit B-like domain-containing protein [Haloechinothrix sp.]
MITRVAVVPHPPLLVPELVRGSEQDTAPVRDAVMDAVTWLRDSCTRWLAIGAHQGHPAHFAADLRGSFAGYGVDVPVALSAIGQYPREGVELPLPVLIAAWLRGRAGAEAATALVINTGTAPEECALIGRQLSDRAGVGALVLGDGSTRHGPRAPGGQDERAGAFDDAVAAALKDVDTAALHALDPALAADLEAGGRAPWQVLAGLTDNGQWRGELLYSGAPFGVGYHVAIWERSERR